MNKQTKVLIVSNIEWSDQNAFGNSISNWFNNLNNIEFASLYTRNSLPNNKVCSKYYRISLLSIIKNVFSHQRIGEYFQLSNKEKEIILKSENINLERKIINYLHKKKIKVFSYLQNKIYRLKWWNNRRYKNFINEFDPDIVFSFITSSESIYMLIKSIIKLKPTCKYVGFIADDVYGVSKSQRSKFIIKDLIDSASILYGASIPLCSLYKKKFTKEINVLYKGCDFDFIESKNFSNNQLSIVYAGNLLYGRCDTLIKLIDFFKKYNSKNHIKIILNIYTSTLLGDSIMDKLNDKETSFLYSSIPYNKIKEVLRVADIVLHVESFDKKQIDIVKYSFSTKIIDCLQSGSPIMAVGPNNIASIEYIKKIPGTIVVDNFDNIGDIVNYINIKDLINSCIETRKYAIENHDINIVQEHLMNDFKKILEKE